MTREYWSPESSQLGPRDHAQISFPGRYMNRPARQNAKRQTRCEAGTQSYRAHVAGGATERKESAMRALVVDDDQSIQQILEFALKDEGYEVVTASNGPEALEKARKRMPDIIILDVMMPFVDGIQVAEALHQDKQLSRTPIIMLTARATDDDVWRGWRAGAASYLTKPVDFDLLFTEIERVIAEH